MSDDRESKLDLPIAVIAIALAVLLTKCVNEEWLPEQRPLTPPESLYTPRHSK